MLRVCAGVAPSPSEHLRGLGEQDDSDGDQQRTDGQGPDAVPDPVSGRHRKRHPDQGEDQPDQGAQVLQHDDDQLRGAGVPDELRPALVPAAVRGLVHRGTQRERLQHDRDPQHHEGPDRGLDVLRVLDLVEALVQGEHPAEQEDDDRDEERVQVAVAAVAERVRRTGRAGGLAAADQQQDLVGRVGGGVHALGQHRAGAGEGERDELAGRDPQVGAQGSQDRLVAAAAAHGGHPRRSRECRTPQPGQ